MPGQLNRVFYCGSGSEAADTALKLARGYWRRMGKPSKTRLIGRAKGYHGVNFGGISVGGIGGNRAIFGDGVSADHLRHTWLPENYFCRGQPDHGAELADELLEILALHDASNVACRDRRAHGRFGRRFSLRPRAISSGYGKSATRTKYCSYLMR